MWLQNINEKELTQHQKIKHICVELCEKAEITLDGLYYHNNKQYFELNMPVKSISHNCKQSFSTLKLLKYHI